MDMSNILKQAQQFQHKLAEIRDELGNRSVTGTAGGGMVTATVNGKQELLAIRIESSVINPEDPVMLQDLILAAVNDGMNRSRDLAQAELGKLTGGMNIPGLF